MTDKHMDDERERLEEIERIIARDGKFEVWKGLFVLNSKAMTLWRQGCVVEHNTIMPDVYPYWLIRPNHGKCPSPFNTIKEAMDQIEEEYIKPRKNYQWIGVGDITLFGRTVQKGDE